MHRYEGCGPVITCSVVRTHERRFRSLKTELLILFFWLGGFKKSVNLQVSSGNLSWMTADAATLHLQNSSVFWIHTSCFIYPSDGTIVYTVSSEGRLVTSS